MLTWEMMRLYCGGLNGPCDDDVNEGGGLQKWKREPYCICIEGDQSLLEGHTFT